MTKLTLFNRGLNPVTVNPRAGVAILFAILLVSIVLTISLSLSNITLKQITLSLLARESQVALYTAESAMACMLSRDITAQESLQDSDLAQSPFGHYHIEGSGAVRPYPFIGPSSPSTFRCDDRAPIPISRLVETRSGGSIETLVSSFTLVFNLADGRKACAMAKVIKDTGAGDLVRRVRYEVYGYNNYDGASGSSGGCYQTSNRTVERAISREAFY